MDFLNFFEQLLGCFGLGTLFKAVLTWRAKGSKRHRSFLNTYLAYMFLQFYYTNVYLLGALCLCTVATLDIFMSILSPSFSRFSQE